MDLGLGIRSDQRYYLPELLNMAMRVVEHDNPSADRFRPPPGQERFEAPKPRRLRSWWTVPLAALYFADRLIVPRIHGRGWLAFAGAALAAGVGVADALVFKKLRDQREENDQVSPSRHITR